MERPGRWVMEVTEKGRTVINSRLARIEPWQLVVISIAGTVFFLRLRRLIRASERSLLRRLQGWAFTWLRRIPAVQREIDRRLSQVRSSLVNTIHKYDDDKAIFHRQLPIAGLKSDQVLHLAESYAQLGGFDVRHGRVSGTVYNDGNVEHAQLLKQIFELYAYSNPLHPDVFPGCRKMEAETIRMVADLYNGGPETCGTMSNGGTESILLACLAYRNRAHRLGIREPEMIVPITAHAAFDKAAFYFGIRIRHIRIDANHRVNIKAMKNAIGCSTCMAMKNAIGSSTCMLVASAPNYPTGTIDPVEEVARYGFAPKGTSVVMYRDKSYLHDQYFCVTDWPGGIYATPTLAGSRSGCNIAMTWATLMITGKEGYVEKTRQIVSATKAIRAGLEKIPGIVPLGISEVSVVAFTSDSFNIYAMSDKLHSRHWNLNTLQKPASIHLCLTANHVIPDVAREFLADVREIAIELSNDPDASAKSNTAAIYGMAASVPDPSLVEDVAKMFIDVCYEPSPSSV